MQHVVKDVEETESVVWMGTGVGCARYWLLATDNPHEAGGKYKEAEGFCNHCGSSGAASWQEGPGIGSQGSQGLFSVWIYLRVLQQPPTIQEMQIRLP